MSILLLSQSTAAAATAITTRITNNQVMDVLAILGESLKARSAQIVVAKEWD
jgi:hypothetical protein